MLNAMYCIILDNNSIPKHHNSTDSIRTNEPNNLSCCTPKKFAKSSFKKESDGD